VKEFQIFLDVVQQRTLHWTLDIPHRTRPMYISWSVAVQLMSDDQQCSLGVRCFFTGVSDVTKNFFRSN
jgi:hypothetical protein